MDDVVSISGSSLIKNAAAVSSSTTSSLSSSSSSSSSSSAAAENSAASFALIFTNYPLMCALAGFAIAQSIKFFTSWYKEREWDFYQLIGSGGMPSAHSATVTALAAAIGFQEGFGGSSFAVASILACIVMYDATGVRMQAGRQAEVLNQIVYGLPAEHPLAESRPLRELLGHTPLQVVAGAFLGACTAAIGHLFTLLPAVISS